MDERTCLDISEFIGVLANPHRVRILCFLAEGERAVGEIAVAVDLPPAHVSSHLRVLYDRGYVERRREWKYVYYSLRSAEVRRFLDMAHEIQQGARTGGA